MSGLIHRLPPVSGEIREMVGMAEHTWFGVGGPAEVMFTPADIDDLARFLAETPDDIPVYAVGAGSNLLVRDEGISGVVISMKGISHHHIEGKRITVGAGATDAHAARKAAAAGIGGLEFLIGIPGTIGGGLRMNAGAFGKEFRDVLVSAVALDRKGVRHRATAEEMGMAYRHSDAPCDWIFVEAVLEGETGDPETIRSTMKGIIATRGASQPQGVRTGGSTFANPDGNKAWRLIDRAGCRGLARGGALVSEKHCNFLINRGDATACDIEALGEMIRERVEADSDIRLRWEIRRVGKKPNGVGHG